VIYESSQKLIKKIESRICDSSQEQNIVIDFFERELFFPLRLLSKGFSLWYRDFLKFTILYILFLILFIWFYAQLKGTQGSDLLIQALYWMTIFVPAVLSMFATPSSYCFYGANRKLVEDISYSLGREIKNSSSQAKAISEIIKLFEKRVEIRIITFRALLAIYWGFIAYYFNTITQKYTALQQQAEYKSLSLLVLGFFFLYVIVESYAKVNDLIFKTAQFACAEISCDFEESKQQI
jgi:hypothetical protein